MSLYPGSRSGAAGIFITAFAALAGLASPIAQAQFSAGISPARIELAIKAGELERKVIQIVNPTSAPAKFKVYTSDWRVDESGKLVIYDDLQPDSCRPWFALERKSFALPPGGTIRYRFEVQPPANWSGTECRVMVFFEGDDAPAAGGPIAAGGRLGVAVYLRPQGTVLSAQIVGVQKVNIKGKSRSAVLVKNTGTATVRLSGNFLATEKSGKKWFLAISGSSVFPGRTQAIPMVAVDPLSPTTEIDSDWSETLHVTGELRLSEIDKTVMPVDVNLPP